MMMGAGPQGISIAPTHLLILQPTSYCNIGCSYCYLAERHLRRRLSLSTVHAVSQFLRGVEIAEEPLTVLWHAGEPLTVRQDFYESAFRILAESPGCPPLRHTIQTNATLIDEKWCELFARWNVHVGVSVDGPAAVHDRERRDRHGRGTHARVMAGIETLLRHEISVSSIGVLTHDAMRFPDDIFEFWLEHDLNSVAVVPEETEGANSISSVSASTAPRYYSFLRRLLQLRDQNPTIRIRELEHVERTLRGAVDDEVVSTENSPGSIISIDADGGVSTFSPELLDQHNSMYGGFVWGNVNSDTWQQVTHNRNFVRVARDIQQGVDQCRTECGFYVVCGGGAPSNKLKENASFVSTETTACRLRVMAATEAVLDHYGL